MIEAQAKADQTNISETDRRRGRGTSNTPEAIRLPVLCSPILVSLVCACGCLGVKHALCLHAECASTTKNGICTRQGERHSFLADNASSSNLMLAKAAADTAAVTHRYIFTIYEMHSILRHSLIDSPKLTGSFDDLAQLALLIWVVATGARSELA